MTQGETELFATIASLRTTDETRRFLRDLCTRSELEAMAHRWQVAKLLDEGLPYPEVAKRAHASTTTVTRVAQWLRNGAGGYRLALPRRRKLEAPSRPRDVCASRRSSYSRTPVSALRRRATARSPSRAETRRSKAS